jgi:hypothetical protein
MEVYGDSILRIIPDPGSTPSNPNVNGWGLRVADFVTPFNEAILQQNDRDVGSGGLLLLPNSMGGTATPHLMVGGGKEGRLYLLNRDNLGRFDPNTDHVVQEMLLPDGIFQTPGLFGNSIYRSDEFRISGAGLPLLCAGSVCFELRSLFQSCVLRDIVKCIGEQPL